MNLEKLQRELLITSNIMNFDVDNLTKMYAYDEQKCEEVLGILSDMAILGNNYIMLLYQSYDKLLSFTNKCIEKYPENEKIITRGRYLNKVIEIEQKRNEDFDEYFEQGLGLFENSIGTFKIPNITSVAQIIFIMLKTTYDIEKALKDDGNLLDFCDFYEKSKDKQQINPEYNYVDSMFNLLKITNPKFKLCFDTNFLITANYLIRGYHPSFKINEDFINLVKEVIDITLNTSIKNDVPGFDEKLYRKLSNITLKSIKRYEKIKRESDQKTLLKQ